jgi:hypothetical protein
VCLVHAHQVTIVKGNQPQAIHVLMHHALQVHIVVLAFVTQVHVPKEYPVMNQVTVSLVVHVSITSVKLYVILVIIVPPLVSAKTIIVIQALANVYVCHTPTHSFCSPTAFACTHEPFYGYT